MFDTEFAVVFETDYSTKILFQGTKEQCKEFMKMNPEMCSTYTFLQELELV
jgi:hypothetical protein